MKHCIFKMKHHAVALLVLLGTGASSPASCIDDNHCIDGYFCSLSHCRKCLNCASLKREPRSLPSNCTKSVVDCGLCFPGFVTDPSDNLDAPCVLAGTVGTAPGQADSSHSYLWIFLTVGIFLVTVIAAIAVYVYRNIDTLKILATTRTSLNSGCGAYREGQEPVPGAPPPYNMAAPQYFPVRPTSPPLDTPVPSYPLFPAAPLDEDPALPFIENKHPRRASVPRARDVNHQAVPFNHRRVRLPEQPPSYDSALSDDESHPELHDEETVESTWTPAEDANNNNHNNSLDVTSAAGCPLSTLLNEAHGTTVVRPPDRRDNLDGATVAKVLCVRPESNVTNFGTHPDSGEGSSQQGHPLDIKIFVQQHNNVKVISSLQVNL